MRKFIAICCTSALIAALAVFAAPALARVADGIPDSWEFGHHLSLNINQAPLDQDRDALNNLNEFRSNTNPRLQDTDRNGTNDGDEDADHDGVSNLREQNGDGNDNEGNNNNNNCDDDDKGGDDDDNGDDDDKGGDDDNGDECDDDDKGGDDDD
jgi:hypothetical protein